MDDFETLVETITKKAKQKGIVVNLIANKDYPVITKDLDASMRICQAIQYVAQKEEKIWTWTYSMKLNKKQIEKAIIDHFGSRIYYRVCVKSAIKVKELELAEFIHKLLRAK